MHKPESIEAALSRLMPPALSPAAQQSIEAMLDDLAATASPVVPAAASPMPKRPAIGLAAAAVLALALSLPFRKPAPALLDDAPADSAAIAPAGMVLIGEADRVESMTDEGWQEDSNGSTMRALRLNVLEENSLLDEETGIVMQVCQPREELLLMPVSTF